MPFGLWATYLTHCYQTTSHLRCWAPKWTPRCLRYSCASTCQPSPRTSMSSALIRAWYCACVCVCVCWWCIYIYIIYMYILYLYYYYYYYYFRKWKESRKEKKMRGGGGVPPHPPHTRRPFKLYLNSSLLATFYILSFLDYIHEATNIYIYI